MFHRSAIRELAPEVPEAFLERSLAALLRRDVIRHDQPAFAGDEAYRFRHLLIRDAAYRSLSQTKRADQHERFAAWLERTAAGRLGEYEEIVGYHLEQAYRCRIELGSADDELKRLGAKGLASGSSRPGAGRSRAATSPRRSACSSARRRSAADDLPRRAELLPELGAALIAAGRLSEADWVLDEASAGRGAHRRRAGRVARARPAAVPAAACTSREGGTEEAALAVAAGDPRLRALRRPPRPLQRPAARGLAALERGARRGCVRGLGARGRPRQQRRRRPRARGDPHLDRLVAVVRADAGRRGHPPLRGDPQRGQRSSRRRGARRSAIWPACTR